MKIQIDTALGKLKAGQVIEVPDKNGVPLEQYWRARLKDSKIDKCCRVVSPTKSTRSNAK